MEQWLTQRSDEALRKLINHEPLTFEDNVVIALVEQRKEIRDLQPYRSSHFPSLSRYHRIFLNDEIRLLNLEICALRRTNEDLRKTMFQQKRLTIGLIAFVVVLSEIVSFLK